MRYDYGDDVSVHGREGTVVGITVVRESRAVHAFGYPVGRVLYTGEFGDGRDSLKENRDS